MFGITTHQQLPAEYITSYAKWDTYMATVWAALLASQPFNQQMTVIEVAPGTSTKIGLALNKCQFRGKLYIIEPEKASLEFISTFYKTIIPEANIIPIQQTLVNSLHLLPKHPNFILANHPLDDMLIANPLDNQHPHQIFDWMLNSTSQLSPTFLEQCAKITTDVNLLTSAKKCIVQQWQHVLHQLQPTTMIMSQYPSIVLKENNQQALNHHASDMLQTLKTLWPQYDQVQSILNRLENYNNKYIGTEILNGRNWFMFRPDKIKRGLQQDCHINRPP